jgi:hypothetical protein
MKGVFTVDTSPYAPRVSTPTLKRHPNAPLVSTVPVTRHRNAPRVSTLVPDCCASDPSQPPAAGDAGTPPPKRGRPPGVCHRQNSRDLVVVPLVCATDKTAET